MRDAEEIACEVMDQFASSLHRNETELELDMTIAIRTAQAEAFNEGVERAANVARRVLEDPPAGSGRMLGEHHGLVDAIRSLKRPSEAKEKAK